MSGACEHAPYINLQPVGCVLARTFMPEPATRAEL